MKKTALNKIPVKPLAFTAAGITALLLLKNIFSGPAKKGANDDTVKAADQEAKKAEAAGQKPSYTEATYKSMADQLQLAMRDWGTDWPSIEGVLNRLNNDVDFLRLYTAFGVRPYYVSGIFQGNFNLTQWFESEFERGLPPLIPDNYADFNKIMASKGIKYRI